MEKNKEDRLVFYSSDAIARDGGFPIADLADGLYLVVDEITEYLCLELPNGKTGWFLRDSFFELSGKAFVGMYFTPPMLFSSNRVNRIDLKRMSTKVDETRFFPICKKEITPDISIYLTIRGDLYFVFYTRAKLIGTYIGKIADGLAPVSGETITINRFLRINGRLVQTNVAMTVNKVHPINDEFLIVEGTIIRKGEMISITAFLSL